MSERPSSKPNSIPKKHLQLLSSSSQHQEDFADISSSSSFVAGSWHTSQQQTVKQKPQIQQQQQQQQQQSTAALGNSQILNTSKGGMDQSQNSGGTRSRTGSKPPGATTTITATTTPTIQLGKPNQKAKITFPLFQPVSYGQQQDRDAVKATSPKNKNKNDATFMTSTTSADQEDLLENQLSHHQKSSMKPYTVEAAGNVPLVGEWLAQRRFLLFPREPPLRDAIWCWALLKSYVLRRDCMDDIPAMRQRSYRYQRKNQQQYNHNKSPKRVASLQNLKKTPVSKSVVTIITESPLLDQTTTSIASQQQPSTPTPTNSRKLLPPMMMNSEKRSNTPNNNWTQQTTPARNILLHPSRNVVPIASPSPSFPQGAGGTLINSSVFSSAAVLNNPKNSPSLNNHVAKLRYAVLSVERRKMWYEKFDSTRRAERDALSEKRIREAVNRNTIKEWTWEEDEMLIQRKLEQEQRSALAKRLAKEKLDRIAHASQSLGISAPIIMADFSFLKLKYFFQLLSERPRNAKEVENKENAKLFKMTKKNNNNNPQQQQKSHYASKNATANREQELDDEPDSDELIAQNEDHFSRYVRKQYLKTLAEEQAELNDLVSKAGKKSSHQQQNQFGDYDDLLNEPDPVVKTAAGIRVEDLSSEATWSELLKLYRRYLVAENVSLDVWKEEDVTFDSNKNSIKNNNNDGDKNEASPSLVAAARRKKQQEELEMMNSSRNPAQHLHPGDKNFHHFPTLIDKVSQRFYTRFLSLDFGNQLSAQGLGGSFGNGNGSPDTTNNSTSSNRHHSHHHRPQTEEDIQKLNSIVSSAYSFDITPPPQLPYINGLKLKGNDLVDEHVVQFPNGNWRSLPGPVSSFHDMTFVLSIRCPLWRFTLVSLDLSENHLTKLPQEVCDIPKLHSLFLHGNQFSSLASLERLSEMRGAQMMRLSLYENPVMDLLGPKEYSHRLRLMFPLLSHLDNVYIPCVE